MLIKNKKELLMMLYQGLWIEFSTAEQLAEFKKYVAKIGMPLELDVQYNNRRNTRVCDVYTVTVGGR